MNWVEQLLAEHPFTSGLTDAQRSLIARGATEQRFEEDSYIFHEHEDADAFYLIVEGSVALKIHVPQLGPIPIQTLSAGQALGWSWLIPPHKWHFDARAFSPVHLIALDGAYLRDLFEVNTDIGFKMLQRITQVLAERLQATRLQLMDVYETAT